MPEPFCSLPWNITSERQIPLREFGLYVVLYVPFTPTHFEE